MTTLAEVRALHDLPLLDLVDRAQTLHRLEFREKLLTTGNPAYEEEMALFHQAGIAPLEPRP